MNFLSKVFSKCKNWYNEEIGDSDSSKKELISNLESCIPDFSKFDKFPGKSVELLNSNPYWNRFIKYSSENDGELIAWFKYNEFEQYVINDAYKKGVINFKKIENKGPYQIYISSNNIRTTYTSFALKNEPVLLLNVMILDSSLSHGDCCVYEFKYFVRSPFAGHLDSNVPLNVSDNVRLFRICNSQRTKELWPNIPNSELSDKMFNEPTIQYNFNEYFYDEHFDEGIPYFEEENRDKQPCLRYDMKVRDFSNVTKGQHVCSIIKNPYKADRKEYKILSPISGIINFEFRSDVKEFLCKDDFIQNTFFLFSVYKDRNSLMDWKYEVGYEKKIEEDRFDSSVSLSFDKVAGRAKFNSDSDIFGEGYKGLEMSTESGINMIVSLQVKNSIPYIIFNFDSKRILLSNGDSVDLLFRDTLCDKFYTLSFKITGNYTNVKFGDVYDINYYCKLSRKDINRMKKDFCDGWRIRFSKYPLLSIEGYNESVWSPREYAGDIFNSYVNRFVDSIDDISENYSIIFANDTEINCISTSNGNSGKCYVYLMCDTTNGYFKIGLSNNPEYREKTLQSEKPTIEKICAKSYPNRSIASAIESALHKAYENKRIRGEWFQLDTNDVESIIATLS